VSLTAGGALKRFIGRKPESRLRQLLADYPPYRIPYPAPGFPGPGHRLTLAEAEANLAFLLANKARRLDIAAGLLRQFGLDLCAGLKGDPEPFLDGLWRWSVDEWPAVYDPTIYSSIERWLRSTRDGPEIVYSMLTDIAIVLAEMILVRRTDYHWALDLDPENEDMASWRRPVVQRPPEGAVPAINYDFELATRTAYGQCTGPAYRVVNDLGRGVLEAISGDAEATQTSFASGRALAGMLAVFAEFE
jgi:hypothetical protein